MKLFWSFIAVTFVCGWLAAPSVFAREVLPGPIGAELLEVKDGDTVRVRAAIWLGQDIEINVRIAGVDTPERGHRAKCATERVKAEKAHFFLEQFLGAGPLTLTNIQYGKYAGRVVADVANGDFEDAGAALMGEGFARTYEGRKRQTWCD